MMAFSRPKQVQTNEIIKIDVLKAIETKKER